MRNAYLACGLLTFVLSSCASYQNQEYAMTAQPNPSRIRYLALGDSYTIGESVPAAARFPEQLAAALRDRGLELADPSVIARTGWTTEELSAAIDGANPQGTFDLVTLLIGVNNQYRGHPVTAYEPEFQALLARAIAFADGDATRVIVVSIPDWGITPYAVGRDPQAIGREIDAFNAVNRARAFESGARYVDITPISRRALEDPSLIAADGLHPSGKMYALWVELILEEALQVLK